MHPLVIVLAAVQAVEIGAAVDTKQHGFAIDHERAVAVAQVSLCDLRKPARPVVAVPRPKPHPLAVALDDQAVAVVLDFVDPFRAVGNLTALVGMQGSNAFLSMIDR